MRWIVIGALALEMAAMTWLVAKAQDRGLPDPALTPGVVVNVDKATLCQVGYEASVRHYDREIRNQVFASYGLTAVDRRDYELDHLVPLSLAGFSSRPDYTISPRCGLVHVGNRSELVTNSSD